MDPTPELVEVENTLNGSFSRSELKRKLAFSVSWRFHSKSLHIRKRGEGPVVGFVVSFFIEDNFFLIECVMRVLKYRYEIALAIARVLRISAKQD